MQRVEADQEWSLFDPRVVPELTDLFGPAFEQAYVQARALGLPATRVLPYQAQLCFGRRDFAQTRALMQSLDQWSALPRLRPVIDFWNPS